MGYSAVFTLSPNLQSGATQIGFAATGTEVTITALDTPNGFWDFFVDNIHFNEELPPELEPPGAPDGGSTPGLLAGSCFLTVLFKARSRR